MRMDACVLRVLLVLTAACSLGATVRTPNFVVEAPTPAIAKQVAVTAERQREELAIKWIGREMRPWYTPCRIVVVVGNVGAGGETSFSFDRGEKGKMEVFGWTMRVQGPLDRILDSVVPHEISHTILACHFRRPLPRWADEGAATMAEDDSEKDRQQRMVEQVLKTDRRIPFRTLLSIREYPQDMRNVLTLYAEGYSLAEFLIQQGGRTRYLAFVWEALDRGWDHAIRHYYNDASVEALEKRWTAWVVAGSPRLDEPKTLQLAEASSQKATRRASEPVIRSQSPDPAGPKSRRDQGVVVAVAEASGRVARTDGVRVPGGGHASVPFGLGLYAPDPRGVRQRGHEPARRTAASLPHVTATKSGSAGIGLALPKTKRGSESPDRTRSHGRGAAADSGFSNHNDGWVPIGRSRLSEPMMSRPFN